MSEKTMIEQGKELGNVKGKGASRQILDLLHVNEMSQHDVCISHRLGLELVLMNEVVGDHLELEPFANNFFDQLAQGVKQNNQSEKFGHIV